MKCVAWEIEDRDAVCQKFQGGVAISCHLLQNHILPHKENSSHEPGTAVAGTASFHYPLLQDDHTP